jgi:hypothetical protein
MKKVTYAAAGALLICMLCAAFLGCTIEVNEALPTLVVGFDDPAYSDIEYGYGLSLLYRVYTDGEGPSTTDTGVAWGSSAIEAGKSDYEHSDPYAKNWDTNIAWNPDVGGNYDVYLYFDVNGTGEFEQWYDYEYDGHLDVEITENGLNSFVVTGEKFFYRTQPANAGVYSETYPVNIEPSWGADTPIPIYLDNTEKTPYEGSYVLKVVFEDAENWLKAQYFASPPLMDVSDSTEIVIYIENSAADFDHIRLGLHDNFGNMAGVDIGPGETNSTATGVGPGGNWDEYTIPFTDLSGLDWTELGVVTFGFPEKTGGGYYVEPLYFDNIHFAP